MSFQYFQWEKWWPVFRRSYISCMSCKAPFWSVRPSSASSFASERCTGPPVSPVLEKNRGDASGAPCVIPFQCLGLPDSHFVWSHLHQPPGPPGSWVFGASSPDSLHLQKRFDLGLPPHFTAKKLFIRSTNRCNSWKACKHMSNPHKYTWQFCSHLVSWLCWLFCRIHTSMLINCEKLYLCQWPCGHLHKAHQLRFYDGRCSATGHIWTSNRVETSDRWHTGLS